MTRNRIVLASAAITVAIAAFFVAPAGARVDAKKAKTATITIQDFKFHPASLKVKAGTTIKVTNASDTTHTVAANNGAFDTGDIDAGSTASFKIKKAGTYKYHCNIHTYMKGVIVATKFPAAVG